MKNEKLKEFVKKIEDRTNDILDDSLMDEDAKEEKFDIDYTDIVKNSAKAKMSKIPWLVSIILIFMIAITFCFMFFKNNPKTLFTQTVDGLFNYLEENVNENVYDITDGNITLNLNLKSKGENEELFSELSKITFNADYVKDNAGNISFIDLKTAYDGSEFINANIYGDGKNTYVYVPNIADKYIKLSQNNVSYFINGNDVKIMLEAINQAVDKVVADEKIYGSKETVDVDGKVIKSYMTKLTIDKTNQDRVATTFINTIKANDEFLSTLSEMLNKSAQELKDDLDNYLNDLKEELASHKKIDISLYVDYDTKEFIKADFVSEKGNINLTNEGDNKYTYTISKNSDNTVINGEFTFLVNDNKTKYIYNLYYKKTQNSSLISEGNIDLKYTTKQATNAKKIDTSDSLDLKNMNELEKLDIYTKIISIPNLNKFLPLIRKVV